MVNSRLLEAPMGADFEAWEFAAGGVFVDGQGLHAEIIRKFLHRVDVFTPLEPFKVFQETLLLFILLILQGSYFICHFLFDDWTVNLTRLISFCQWILNNFNKKYASLYIVDILCITHNPSRFLINYQDVGQIQQFHFYINFL